MGGVVDGLEVAHTWLEGHELGVRARARSEV